MALADNAARAASAARSSGGTPSAAAKAAKGSASSQTAFKVVKPKPASTTKTTKPATKPATKPKATKPAAKPNTDPTSQYGLQEDASVSEATNVYNAGVALRTFQEKQARRQLEDALAEIDRAAIGNYKGIANDYAARGMARTGGYNTAEDEAVDNRDRADKQAEDALDDILYQLGLQSTADTATFNTAKDRILADFLARRFAPAQGGR